MRNSILLTTLAGVAAVSAQTITGRLGDAQVVTNNPLGASYVATLPNSASNSVRGSVVAISSPSGRGVDFAVTFNGLPESGGPFTYHVHDQPVPADGNCTATLAHLDPYIRGEDIPCNPAAPQTCQVGDLSGKHGAINGTAYSIGYNDLYASLVPGLGSFIGNRSIVVHYANKTRITCANFTSLPLSSSSSSSSVTASAASAASASGSMTVYVPVPVPSGSGAPSNASASAPATASGTATGGAATSAASGSRASNTAGASATSSGGGATAASPSVAVSTGAAAAVWVSSGAVLAGVVAAML